MANMNSMAHFSSLPSVDVSRSGFDRTSSVKTTIREGMLTPIYFAGDVVPGDTVRLDFSNISRLLTPVVPVMDDAYLQIDFFFVPERLLMKDYKTFHGEVGSVPGVQMRKMKIPTVKISPRVGSLADHLGLPCFPQGDSTFLEVNVLPFRGYSLIWNEYYRDQNVMTAAAFYDDDIDRGTIAPPNCNDAGVVDYTNPFVGLTTAVHGSHLLPVAKFHDYFTSALPFRQRSEDPTTVPITGLAPVLATNMINQLNTQIYEKLKDYRDAATNQPLTTYPEIMASPGGNGFTRQIGDLKSGISSSGVSGVTFADRDTTVDVTGAIVAPANLQAIMDLGGVSVDINDLRQGFAVQRFLELSAMYGSRLQEKIYGNFGVISPDQRLQRPECIARRRMRIGMQQVVQTSATYTSNEDDTGAAKPATPQGNTAAFSLTADVTDGLITYSATEYGYLYGLASLRVVHSYQQGLDRIWKRTDMFDYYLPAFQNIGFQPIYNYEIYADGSDADMETFGFAPAFEYMRYRQNQIHGQMRDVDGVDNFSVWHWADKYTSRPMLSPGWLVEGQNMNKTIAVEAHDQLLNNFVFKETWYRPLSVYGIPSYLAGGRY